MFCRQTGMNLQSCVEVRVTLVEIIKMRLFLFCLGGNVRAFYKGALSEGSLKDYKDVLFFGDKYEWVSESILSGG